MKADKVPAEEANESSDFDEACDVALSSSSPKRILSSSLSSLEGEQPGVDDSDNDSGFVGVSQGSLDRLNTATPDVNKEINELYDRDAILYDLANSGDPFKGMSFLKIEAMQKAATRQASSGENAEVSDKESQEMTIERIRKVLEAVPDSMLHLLTGVSRPGDCGRPSDQKPDWLDMEKLRRGQKFARDHMFPIYFAELLSLFALFSFEDGLKPLIITGRSNTPYSAFKRYLSTGLRIRRWYTEDPWAKGSSARKDVLTVRIMHAAVKRKLDATTNSEIDEAAFIPNAWCPTREILLKDFAEGCAVPRIGQCPYAISANNPDRPKGINQVEMASTQWGFIGLIVTYPKSFGVHSASDEDLEAFCHLWRSLGYQLGMEDEYNFCRGTLADVRQRSHDFLETWVKPNFRELTPAFEHMMRCIFTGVNIFLPGATYETSLLYLGEILDIKMPRLYASLSYKDWISHNLTKSLFHYTIRLPGMAAMINNFLNRALDRAEKFTPEELEAIRIKLSKLPESNIGSMKNSIFNSSS